MLSIPNDQKTKKRVGSCTDWYEKISFSIKPNLAGVDLSFSTDVNTDLAISFAIDRLSRKESTACGNYYYFIYYNNKRKPY